MRMEESTMEGWTRWTIRSHGLRESFVELLAHLSVQVFPFS